MRVCINLLVGLLVVVSSTQVLIPFVPGYQLVDEGLLLLLSVLVLIDGVYGEPIKIHKNKIIFIGCLLAVITLSEIINFFSFKAFAIKFVYYFKVLLPFLLFGRIRVHLNPRTLRFIGNVIFFVSLISIFEYFYIKYVDNSISKYVYLKYREGNYRAMGLTGHPISLGMMAFMGGFFQIKQKKSYFSLRMIVFFLAILFSGSRIPLLLFALLLIWEIGKVRFIIYRIRSRFSLVILFFLPVIIVFFLFKNLNYFEKKEEGVTTRSVAIGKGMELLKNPVYLLFGTGIGSFGTYESVEHGSWVYKKLRFPKRYANIILENKSSGMESFLFMSLFELGLIGWALYYLLIFNIDSRRNKYHVLPIVIILVYSMVYPLYTLPFIFLFLTFAPQFVNKSQVWKE